jgi:hypothetical protein
MESFLWFFLGAMCSNILTKLLNFGKMALFAENVSNQCLKLMGTVAEDVAFLKQTKEDMLRQMKIPENEIKIQVNLDDYTFNMWKRAAVNNFISLYPHQFKRNVKFYNWDTAMEKLSEIYKNQK